jgi:hypothetical protein
VSPLILLDIDGVVSVSSGSLNDGWTGHTLIADGRGAYVEVRDDLPDLLVRLAATGDLTWASGWNDGAPVLFAQLLPWLGELPHLTFASAGKDVQKLPVVREAVGDRAVAWIDDRIPDEAWEWAERRAAPTLLVPVDPQVGLGPDDVATVEAWASSSDVLATPPDRRPDPAP